MNTHSLPASNHRQFATWINALAPLLFFTLAFLPIIARVLWPGVSITSPYLFAGLLLAGYGLAARLNHTRVGFLSLGAFTNNNAPLGDESHDRCRRGVLHDD